MIVDRLEPAAIDVAQQVGQAPLAFAGIESDPEIEGFLQIGRQHGQHGNAPARMEPPDHDGNIGRPELPGDVERPRELVGLDADQTDEA